MGVDDHLCVNPPCPEVKKVGKAVFGNGHPEESLIVRVCNVEKKLTTIQKLSWVTVCGVGTLVLRFLGTWLETLIR